MTDRRVCPADGGDHDWQDKLTARACGPRGQVTLISTGYCPKCRTDRTVVSSAAGREVTDVVRPS